MQSPKPSTGGGAPDEEEPLVVPGSPDELLVVPGSPDELLVVPGSPDDEPSVVPGPPDDEPPVVPGSPDELLVVPGSPDDEPAVVAELSDDGPEVTGPPVAVEPPVGDAVVDAPSPELEVPTVASPPTVVESAAVVVPGPPAVVSTLPLVSPEPDALITPEVGRPVSEAESVPRVPAVSSRPPPPPPPIEMSSEHPVSNAAAHSHGRRFAGRSKCMASLGEQG